MPNKVRIDAWVDPGIQKAHDKEIMWRSFCAALLFKLVGPNKPVVISSDDIRAMHDHFKPDAAVVMVQGGTTANEFCLVSETRADIVEAGMRGPKS